jgi:hypothetical protein
MVRKSLNVSFAALLVMTLPIGLAFAQGGGAGGAGGAAAGGSGAAGAGVAPTNNAATNSAGSGVASSPPRERSDRRSESANNRRRHRWCHRRR